MRGLFNRVLSFMWSLEFGWIFTKLWLWFLVPLFPQLPRLHTIQALGLMYVVTIPALPFLFTERRLYKIGHENFSEEELALMGKAKFNKDDCTEEELVEAAELSAYQDELKQKLSVRTTNHNLIMIFLLGPAVLGFAWIYHFMIEHGFVGP